MTIDESVPFIKELLAAPPACITNAKLVSTLQSIPIMEQVVAMVKFGLPCDLSDLFNPRNPNLLAINSFLEKQYHLMSDMVDLLDSYKAERPESLFTKYSVWGVGLIASAMQENLLQFAWLADNFVPRANLFYNFSAVQDLESYPASNADLKKQLLCAVKPHAETYKRNHKTKFNSDADYANQNNYVNEWYKPEVRNIEEISKDIKLQIDYCGDKIDWNVIYQHYCYLCNFKHINAQRQIIHSVWGPKGQDFNFAVQSGIRSFVLLNSIVIKLYNDNNNPKDAALIALETKINEFYAKNQKVS